MFTFGVCNVLYNSLGSIFVGQEAVLSFTSNFLLKVNFHGAYGRRVIDIIKNMNYSCTQPWHKLFNPDSRWKMRGHILLHVRVIKIGNMKLPAMFLFGSNFLLNVTNKLLALYYYMRNFCNLIGLEQWYFSLI